MNVIESQIVLFRRLVRSAKKRINAFHIKLLRWDEIKEKTNINDHQIAMMTNTCTYTCNPKYIYQEIQRRKLPVHIIWIVDEKWKKKYYPQDADVVWLYSSKCAKAVYSSKLWIDNGIAFSDYFDKKAEQIHIQTMHGSLGIKKLDNAVLSRNKSGITGQKVVKRETNNTDYVITNSAFEESVFRRIFWKKTPMLRLGHARTDILFCKDQKKIKQIREQLYNEFGVPIDRKLILYAPTYRAYMTADDIITDFEKLNNAFRVKWGGEFSTLLRFHARTKNIVLKTNNRYDVFDVSRYPDIQELMLVADAGITDYSSWIYDYVLTRKPGFIFATDRAKYDIKTGLCYPLEETPFPVSENFDELLKNINKFDDTGDYKKKIESFLMDKEAVDDGHSAERIVDHLCDILKLDQ